MAGTTDLYFRLSRGLSPRRIHIDDRDRAHQLWQTRYRLRDHLVKAASADPKSCASDFEGEAYDPRRLGANRSPSKYCLIGKRCTPRERVGAQPVSQPPTPPVPQSASPPPFHQFNTLPRVVREMVLSSSLCSCRLGVLAQPWPNVWAKPEYQRAPRSSRTKQPDRAHLKSTSPLSGRSIALGQDRPASRSCCRA
jgi:hypothetical protein